MPRKKTYPLISKYTAFKLIRQKAYEKRVQTVRD